MRKRPAGTWRAVLLGKRAGTSRDVTVKYGRSYRYQVRQLSRRNTTTRFGTALFWERFCQSEKTRRVPAAAAPRAGGATGGIDLTKIVDA